MPTIEDLEAARHAAEEAAAELQLAHRCVAAAYELEASPEAREAHPLAALINPCIAAAAALNVTMTAKRAFEDLARICEQYAAGMPDSEERRVLEASTASVRDQVRLLAKLVADDGREFARDCSDIAARLGFEVISVPEEDGERDDGKN
jgi:hypothetical protein